ncbi:hypothetical protein [Dokdonella sp.]|uniref:hypothetical protein n=1 Tax=Dokdonella sp. TaxID=2291710 RepID=UPI001B13F5A2|nr:hypothetical protein [Dokdonella sp.]MBO9665153.1 hypothetical protein [Dokdonella sp.]
MLDESSLARLAEMGIDVYVPRSRGEALRMRAEPSREPAAPGAPVVAQPAVATAASAGVLLVGQATAKPAMLLADVARALRFARIDCAACETPDETMLQAARALVLFGEAPVRAVGALLPAQRQREIGWIVSGDVAALVGDARAKRALWSELRRVVRTLSEGERRG